MRHDRHNRGKEPRAADRRQRKVPHQPSKCSAPARAVPEHSQTDIFQIKKNRRAEAYRKDPPAGHPHIRLRQKAPQSRWIPGRYPSFAVLLPCGFPHTEQDASLRPGGFQTRHPVQLSAHRTAPGPQRTVGSKLPEGAHASQRTLFCRFRPGGENRRNPPPCKKGPQREHPSAVLRSLFVKYASAYFSRVREMPETGCIPHPCISTLSRREASACLRTQPAPPVSHCGSSSSVPSRQALSRIKSVSVTSPSPVRSAASMYAPESTRMPSR